jgi:hypothetical protein
MTRDYISKTMAPDFLSRQSLSRTDRSFADVLIRVGEKEFYCHAFLLAAQSEYFKTALDKVWIKKRGDGLAELDLSQFEQETVDSVIEFIYSGKVGFSGNGAISKIAEAADYLLIPVLFELCLEGVGEFTSEVVPMFVMAAKLENIRAAMNCIKSLPTDWNESESIKTLDERMIRLIIICSSKDPDTERWKILLKWADAKCTDDQDSRATLLYRV